MCKRLLGFIMVLSFFFNVQSQEASENVAAMPQTTHPSKGIVIAVLTVMFAISFILLAYVKFCRNSPTEFLNRDIDSRGLTRSGSRYSGIDKQVIEALPFFKFSSLKGPKEGLECAVCLSKFEDTEVLRLLPKCKHAFHMNCIDKWLESHPTCPLCRYRVEPGDIKTFNSSISSRFLRVPSNITEDPSLEIFVHREQSRQGSSRFISYRKPVHRLNHKIVISDVATRSRWSDLNSSDLLSLNTEMLGVMSSTTLSPSNEEDNSFTLLNNPGEKRSMSEITNVTRFAEVSMQNNGREERLRRIWLPIVEQTVQWLARRERSLTELEHKRLAPNV